MKQETIDQFGSVNINISSINQCPFNTLCQSQIRLTSGQYKGIFDDGGGVDGVDDVGDVVGVSGECVASIHLLTVLTMSNWFRTV